MYSACVTICILDWLLVSIQETAKLEHLQNCMGEHLNMMETTTSIHKSCMLFNDKYIRLVRKSCNDERTRLKKKGDLKKKGIAWDIVKFLASMDIVHSCGMVQLI